MKKNHVFLIIIIIIAIILFKNRHLIREFRLKTETKAKGFSYDYDKLVYDLVWFDEFDNDGLPVGSKWSYEVGGDGWGNNELQYYTAGENVYIKDGYMTIEAKKEEYKDSSYTSSRIVSKGSGDWLYGKIEVKAKLPYGRGTWPAIWMLPTETIYGTWPKCGEIDIMEHVGYELNYIHSVIHTDSYNHLKNNQYSASKYIATATEDFHIYTLEWLPDKIHSYIDGELYFTFNPTQYTENPTYKEWPFDQKMHLILNLAIGGSWGSVMGVDETIFPQKMSIDYVRVYQSQEINKLRRK